MPGAASFSPSGIPSTVALLLCILRRACLLLMLSGKDIMPACATMLGIQHARSCLIQPIRYTVCCLLLPVHTMLCLSAAHAEREGHHTWLCHYAGHPACQELPRSAHQVYCLLSLAAYAHYACLSVTHAKWQGHCALIPARIWHFQYRLFSQAQSITSMHTANALQGHQDKQDTGCGGSNRQV